MPYLLILNYIFVDDRYEFNTFKQAFDQYLAKLYPTEPILKIKTFDCFL